MAALLGNNTLLDRAVAVNENDVREAAHAVHNNIPLRAAIVQLIGEVNLQSAEVKIDIGKIQADASPILNNEVKRWMKKFEHLAVEQLVAHGMLVVRYKKRDVQTLASNEIATVTKYLKQTLKELTTLDETAQQDMQKKRSLDDLLGRDPEAFRPDLEPEIIPVSSVHILFETVEGVPGNFQVFWKKTNTKNMIGLAPEEKVSNVHVHVMPGALNADGSINSAAMAALPRAHNYDYILDIFSRVVGMRARPVHMTSGKPPTGAAPTNVAYSSTIGLGPGDEDPYDERPLDLAAMNARQDQQRVLASQWMEAATSKDAETFTELQTMFNKNRSYSRMTRLFANQAAQNSAAEAMHILPLPTGETYMSAALPETVSNLVDMLDIYRRDISATLGVSTNESRAQGLGTATAEGVREQTKALRLHAQMYRRFVGECVSEMVRHVFEAYLLDTSMRIQKETASAAKKDGQFISSRAIAMILDEINVSIVFGTAINVPIETLQSLYMTGVLPFAAYAQSAHATTGLPAEYMRMLERHQRILDAEAQRIVKEEKEKERENGVPTGAQGKSITYMQALRRLMQPGDPAAWMPDTLTFTPRNATPKDLHAPVTGGMPPQITPGADEPEEATEKENKELGTPPTKRAKRDDDE